ncbi:MAG: DNA polymerase III subunit delta [Kiloniellales bacterium]
MKISATQADRFAASPDARVVAVLVYGPDGGLVRERAGKLVRSVVEDPGDPFRVAELTGQQANDDPARLGDELAAMALTGGRRVVRLRDPDEALAAPLSAILEAPPGDALLVIEAGDLAPRSALRKLFESAGNGAALPCYKDDAESLPSVIRGALAEAGLEVAPDALGFLASRLGEDRQVTRRELEKLVLYMQAPAGGSAERRQVMLEDAVACVGDNAALTLDDLVYATADGDLVALERILERSLQEGLSPIAALRAVAGHFQRLHLVAGLAAGGLPQADAMKRLRPPVFWKMAERFKAQQRAWSAQQLGRALARLLEAELACKSSGAPAESLAARALLEIAANAPTRAQASRRQARAH